MIEPNRAVKHYRSAHRRFLAAGVAAFMERECPKIFGPELAGRLAERLVELILSQLPQTRSLEPGQVLWNAVSCDTRPNSPRVKLVPVVLTLVAPDDVKARVAHRPLVQISADAIARITREAHAQGALLSMRDVALLTWHQDSYMTTVRQSYEERLRVSLPFTGSLQDFGSCISHKAAIVRKVVMEKKDPATVARETRHSQRAVDRYLKDYHRVDTCRHMGHSVELIQQVTCLSRGLIRQYLDIIAECENLKKGS